MTHSFHWCPWATPGPPDSKLLLLKNNFPALNSKGPSLTWGQSCMECCPRLCEVATPLWATFRLPSKGSVCTTSPHCSLPEPAPVPQSNSASPQPSSSQDLPLFPLAFQVHMLFQSSWSPSPRCIPHTCSWPRVFLTLFPRLKHSSLSQAEPDNIWSAQSLHVASPKP